MKNNLKDARKKRNITQAELAHTVSVSQQTIHSIENNKFIPSILTALKIASSFNIRVEDIFQLDSED